MARIEAVLLDVGGVFILPEHDRISSALERAGVSADPSDFDRAHYLGVANLDHFVEGDREIWHAYNCAYARACGADEEHVADAVEALLNEFTVAEVWTRIVPGSTAALGRIADLGVKLAIVSNADGTVEEQLRSDGICQVGPGRGIPVDTVLDSTVVGVAKPDPQIFEIALDRIGISADRAIHVGDTPAADVAGARAAGIRPVLIDPYDLHEHLEVDRVRSLAEVVELVGRDRTP